jgi:hypothetical protein
MQVVTTLGICHIGISILFRRILYRPLRIPKALFTAIRVDDCIKFQLAFALDNLSFLLLKSE